jgi:Flp pilus assembly pilin Flp
MEVRKAIRDLLADERGAESVEFGMVSFVVACATIHWRRRVQGAVDAQVAAAFEEADAEV